MLAEAWAALGGAPAAVGSLQLHGPARRFGGGLDCDGLLRACAGGVALAAAELAEARGVARPEVAIDGGAVAVAAVSERFACVVGEEPLAGFAPLSRFVACADGWARLHGTYPQHRRALAAVLETEDPDAAVAACAGWEAEALEDAVVAAGGCAAAVRYAEAWAAHPQGAWLAAQPLVAVEQRPGDVPLPPLPAGALPAAGLRVLDLTKVIAGPVATRTLAALGADVLRLGRPGWPEVALHRIDSFVGKRTALLDLGAEAERLHGLLAQADVLIGGYRPGALDRFGLSPEAVAERHPHLADVRLSAWGDGGPWGARRGFDSLVQAAGGIALHEGDPGALPAQALDHGTGWLAAAAALRGLARRASRGGGSTSRLALAATGAWLLRHPVARGETALPEPTLLRLPTPGGQQVQAAAPPFWLDGTRATWTSARTSEDADHPSWR